MVTRTRDYKIGIISKWENREKHGDSENFSPLNDPHLFQEEGGVHILADPVFQGIIEMEVIIHDFGIEIIVFDLFQLFGNFTEAQIVGGDKAG